MWDLFKGFTGWLSGSQNDESAPLPNPVTNFFYGDDDALTDEKLNEMMDALLPLFINNPAKIEHEKSLEQMACEDAIFAAYKDFKVFGDGTIHQISIYKARTVNHLLNNQSLAIQPEYVRAFTNTYNHLLEHMFSVLGPKSEEASTMIITGEAQQPGAGEYNSRTLTSFKLGGDSSRRDGRTTGQENNVNNINNLRAGM